MLSLQKLATVLLLLSSELLTKLEGVEQFITKLMLQSSSAVVFCDLSSCFGAAELASGIHVLKKVPDSACQILFLGHLLFLNSS